MDILGRIAEQRLREAVERGELDDYAGKGEPLDLEDLSHVPEDLRAGYALLKSHGFVPDELVAHREIVSLDRLIDRCRDDGERDELETRSRALRLRFALALEARGVPPEIVERIVARSFR
jgi:hypothetical protein